MSAQLSADGEAVWCLLDSPEGPSGRALLAKLTEPGTVESVRRLDIPAAPSGFMPSPDDTLMAVHLDGSVPRLVLVSIDPDPATVTSPRIADRGSVRPRTDAGAQ